MRLSASMIGNAAVLLLAAASIAAGIRGWLYSDMGSKIAWQPEAVQRLALLSLGFWAVLLTLLALSRRRFPVNFGAAALLGLVGFAGAVPVASTLLLFVAALAVGDWLWSPATPEPGRRVAPLFDVSLRMALGLAVLMTVVQTLGPLPIHGSLFYALLLIVPITLRARALWELLAPCLDRRDRDIAVSEVLLFGVLANLVLVSVVATLLPEVGHDALALHLAVAAHIRDFGHWHYDVLRNVYAVIPLGGDYLFAIGYVFGGEAAARLVNLAALLVTLGLVFGAIRKTGSRSVALVATMLAASSPLALLASTSLFIENPLALFVVAAMLCALTCLEESVPRRLYMAALLFGAAAATKLIAFALLPAMAATLALALYRVPRTRRVHVALVTSAIAIAFAAAPYAIALVKTGNPVFPLYNAIFASPLYPPVNFHIAQFPGTLDPLAVYRMTFYSDQYVEGRPGAFGFTFILLAAPVLGAAFLWGTAQIRLLAFAVISFLVIALAGSAYLRYVYPVGFLFAILAGWVMSDIRAARGVRAGLGATAGIGVLLNIAFLPAATAQMRALDLVAIADDSARERYVTAWAPMRDMVRFLNAYKSDSSAVLVLGAAHIAELERTSYTDSGYMRDFRDRLRRIKTTEQLRGLLHAHDIGFALLDTSERATLRAHLQALAHPIYRSGIATLYQIDTRVRFSRELVQHPVLSEGFAGWVTHGHVPWDTSARAARVNVSNVLYQPVPLTAERAYRLAVEAKCADHPAQFRLQVNWIGANGNDLGPSLRVAPCASEWSEEETILTAPSGATTGVVYAAGHSADPILIRNVSLRTR